MIHPDRSGSYRNRLLSALPPHDLMLLKPHLKLVTLELRQSLEEPHRRISLVYFIEKGIASVVTSGQARQDVETGLIGPEGMTGLAVILGNHQSPNTTFVQAEGSAFSIKVEALHHAMDTSVPLRRVLLNFVQVFLIQTAQTAAANASLTLQGRLARWLLMTEDRLGKGGLPMTHEFLAKMLGVRRAGVTDAIHVLEGNREIKAARSVITIENRKALEARAGILYGLAEAEYVRLIGLPAAHSGPRS